MRTIINILLATLLLPVMTACSNSNEMEEIEPPHDIMSYTHYLYVKFEDQQGQNLVENLEYSDILEYRPYDLYRVSKDCFTLSFSIGEKDYNRYSARLVYSIIDNEAYLNFEHSRWGQLEPKRTQYLRCEQIFGDDDCHVIVAEHVEAQRGCKTKCVRFTLDGVEYAVDEDDKVVVKL